MLLRALGVPDTGIPNAMHDRVALYRTTVAHRQVLILLDNARSARQVRSLLPNSAGSCTVVTSRNRLDGLIVQDGAHLWRVDQLTEDEALDLVSRIAGADRLRAEPSHARTLINMCDRLPLAIRVAAARLVTNSARSLSQLVAELSDQT